MSATMGWIFCVAWIVMTGLCCYCLYRWNGALDLWQRDQRAWRRRENAPWN